MCITKVVQGLKPRPGIPSRLQYVRAPLVIDKESRELQVQRDEILSGGFGFRFESTRRFGLRIMLPNLNFQDANSLIQAGYSNIRSQRRAQTHHIHARSTFE